MKAPVTLLLLAAMGFFATVHATESRAPRITPESFGWLTGTWRMERSGRVVTETWSEAAGGTMLATSRTIANRKTVEYEFVVLREDPAGEVFYVAKPSGQSEAAFKLVHVAPGALVFENPQHDFPQRIRYTLNADGTLVAAIEGEKNGKSRRVEFVYRRVTAP